VGQGQLQRTFTFTAVRFGLAILRAWKLIVGLKGDGQLEKAIIGAHRSHDLIRAN
jgi:hypothetical protein